MKSLRLRFFVVVWLFVVTALVVLGTLLGRWTTVEMARISMETRSSRAELTVDSRLLDSVAAHVGEDSVALSTALRRLVPRDSMRMGAVVFTREGRVAGGALDTAFAASVSLGRDGEAMIGRDMQRDGGRQMIRMAIPSYAVGSAGHRLVVVPALRTSSTSIEREVSGARPQSFPRRVAIAVLVGSILSAIVTALIAQPLLGRVGELSRATAALRRGDHAARVAVRGDDEIAELGHAFNALSEDLGASETQRRRMVADVAHELRTPLTNIIGLLEAARDGLQPIDDRVLLALHEEASLLNRLVDDLRDLALADAGELPLALEALPALAEANRAAAAFPALPGEAQIVVTADAPDLLVRADAQRLGQVLRNLLQNARRHSPDGGTVALRVTPADAMVRFTVADHGPGIAPEHLSHLWERFYRIDASRAKATGGMGLGLALVARLTEAMGGTVGVESTVGEGSSFRIDLPAAGG